MTSKEALNQLYIMADTPEQAMIIQSYYNIVEKDLEVLEILKNILKIKKSDLYGFEIVVRGSDEQENKVKEWLNGKFM